ncbi:hypothetical protein LTR37_009222 [Vermiconidia calcicola]|uniref:Uncharacterized protein n=1 Tax=Vermiconidia calcicola TaxID=1690605 RepID=A0ACC3NA08_9PEZI|nr:hypothetical protein LTR37_009222 [Vermiconidia calcicola]
MARAAECAKQFQDAEVVSVHLDGTSKTFYVQRALLCAVSDYFRKALQGPFAEGKTKTLRLPGCSESIFELILYWLCHQALPLEIENEASPRNPTDASPNQRKLIELWCLAVSYLMEKLQNAAMHSLLTNFAGNHPGVDAIRLTRKIAVNDSMVHDVVMEELAASYSRGGYTLDEKDSLGAIPGVMNSLIAELRECWMDYGSGKHPPAPSEQDYGEWML